MCKYAKLPTPTHGVLHKEKFYHKDNITKELTSKSQKFGNYTLNDIICNETD